MPSPSSPAATSKDCNSRDGEIIPQTRREANVIVKRSDTFDMGNKKPAVAPDTANDTGNTSLSAAAMSSADSGQKSDSTSVMVDPPPAPRPRRRPIVLVDQRRVSSQSRPKIPLMRPRSAAGRRVEEDPMCTVPNYQWRKSHNRRPPTLSPLESELELNLPPVENWSPISAQQPPPYIQPAVSARRRPSSSSRARPVSYHASVIPNSASWVSPPRSTSAYFNQQMPGLMRPSSQMGATPPTGPGFYPPGHPLQTTLPYDTQRPPLQQQISSQYNTRRPTAACENRPVISYDQPHYGKEMPISTIDDTFSFSSEDGDEYDEDTDRALIPPPNTPQRRPSLRPSITANPSANPRAPFVGFPKATLYPSLSGNPMVKIENAISRRRQSYMGHENRRELDAKYLDTKLYKDDIQAQQRLSLTNLDARRYADDLEAKNHEVEIYRQRIGYPNSTPSASASSEEITMPIDALTSINLEFVGDLEGRTIHSSHDGGIELITGAPRGKGTAYPSDRASIADRSTESTVTTKLDVRTNEAHILSKSNPDSKAWPESTVEDSVFGDTSSVSSLADTTFSDQGASLSSQSSTEELTTAADELVALLQADKELKPLYTIALTKASLGAERFERNFHRLLKMYAKDLKAEAKESLHYMAAQLTYSRARYVVNAIRKQYDQDCKDRTERLASAIRQKARERLDRYLSRLDTRDQYKALATDLNDDTDASTSDEDEWDNDSTPLRTLEQVKAFMISGEAIKNLRCRFKSFVDGSSGESLEPEQKGLGGIDSPSPKQEQTVTSSGEVKAIRSSQINVSQKDQRGHVTQTSIEGLEDNVMTAISELEDTTATSPDADPSRGSNLSSIVVRTPVIISKSSKTEKLTNLLIAPQPLESTPENVEIYRDNLQNHIQRVLRTCTFGLLEFVVASLGRQMNWGLREYIDHFSRDTCLKLWMGALPKLWLHQTHNALEVLGVCEKKIASGSQRLRWTCSCGKSLYDDFVELRPGALEELQGRLESESLFKRCDDGDNSSTPGQLFGLGGFFSCTRPSSSSCQGNNRAPPSAGCLPTHNLHSGFTVSTTSASAPTIDLLYLLLCINSSNFGADLYYERIQHINCDRALFYYLHEIYAQRRSKLRSAISLRTVRSINLVKFAADMSAKVDIYPHSMYCDKTICTCMPPESIVEPAPNSEYRCKPIPASHIPPIGENYMMHLYSSPGCIDPSQLWVYNQFPKRTRGRLTARPEAPAEGWGVHFREGWNWPKIWAVVLTFFFGASLIFGVLYAVLKRDAQSAFGIASYWIAAATILLGYLTTRNA